VRAPERDRGVCWRCGSPIRTGYPSFSLSSQPNTHCDAMTGEAHAAAHCAAQMTSPWQRTSQHGHALGASLARLRVRRRWFRAGQGNDRMRRRLGLDRPDRLAQ
jgi:hypothetical protein